MSLFSEEARAKLRAFQVRLLPPFMLLVFPAFVFGVVWIGGLAPACEKRKDPAEKLAACDRALFFLKIENPRKSIRFHAERAVALGGLGRDAEAVRAFETALAIGWREGDVWSSLELAAWISRRHGADAAVLRNLEVAKRRSADRLRPGGAVIVP